ncbi:hypothetical protein H6F67_03605 [Microcoleus sp. FACHB-1515]|uniref:hypothetical protein n=1 Tax=Cyanophyceae TaxID=3028117 RepID=UPI0016886DBF|nr:hypothetical protein [Microcoleus sp. FACHB-1515]MBD2088937.1 hypothetical protein [Microcoleus sp. FACHB-1515]
MEYPEIGLVIAQLAQYNQIKLVDDKQAIINKIIDQKSLVLPGGIQVIREENKPISPSCCCGLETWREWIDFLSTGTTPWLGHDPSPWLERQGNSIRIWSDGGIAPVRKAFHVEVSRAAFEKALRQVERDLQAFLFCIESWGQEIGISNATELFKKFDKCFSVRKPSRMR